MSIFPVTCPCCGYKNITATFDICDICFWEHDLVMEARPDEVGGANPVSLREAQANFLKYGATNREVIGFTRRPTPEDVKDPLWKPV